MAAKKKPERKEVEQLETIDKSSDKYLKQLYQEIFDLRQRLGEEKLIAHELQNIKAQLQGRIDIHYQRMEELGIDRLKEMMEKVKGELRGAKHRQEEMTSSVLTEGLHMLKFVGRASNVFEDLRMQFKNSTSIGRHLALEVERCEHLDKKIQELKEKIKAKTTEHMELKSSFTVFDGIDVMIDNLIEELETTSREITDLNFKLEKLELENRETETMESG